MSEDDNNFDTAAGILYGQNDRLHLPEKGLVFDFDNYPIPKNVITLQLMTWPFENWAYAGVGSAWCGNRNWAVDRGNERRFPDHFISPQEREQLPWEKQPAPNISSRIDAGVRNWENTIDCRLELHRPDLEDHQLPLGAQRVEVHYSMSGKDYRDQANIAEVQALLELMPTDVKVEWRYLPRSGLMAYDKRYDKLQGVITTSVFSIF